MPKRHIGLLPRILLLFSKRIISPNPLMVLILFSIRRKEVRSLHSKLLKNYRHQHAHNAITLIKYIIHANYVINAKNM